MRQFRQIILSALLCLITPLLTHAQFTQQGNKLVGTGAVGVAQQGTSVSLSSDGSTAIVGGPLDSSYAGGVWVWTRSGGVWTQQGGKLVGTGAVNGTHGAYQGTSVSLSSDGNTAIVGGNYDNGSGGAVWVWTRTGGVWTQQGSKLVGTGAVGTAQQGTSVSLSSDGNTAMAGGYKDSSGAGAVWVWTRTGGVWTQQGSKLVGTGAVYIAFGENQGGSVSLSSDGNTAIVSGPLDNLIAGAVWVWSRAGGVWTQQGSKLVGTGAVGGAYQGSSVSLSSDGKTTMVGGPGDNSNVGAAWIFTRPATPVLPRAFAVQHLNLENEKSLRFDLPKKSHVVIQLFNSQGRMISQLLDETRDAGSYNLLLSKEAQGSYYLDFRAGDYHRTVKMR